MSLKLSYILPCYNVERYIADCLDSIYAQDMPEDEFEVICVNDCSTDGTRAIIADFTEKHSNLSLIDHKSNLTAGESRNTGARQAKGEYIWFVDPDDMINPSCSSFLYGKAKEKALDILLFNHEIVDEAKQFLKVIKTFQDSELFDGQGYVVNYFPSRFSQLCIVWRCLFRTGFLRDFNLLFPAMNKAEDVSFLWEAMLRAQRVASVGEIGYTYRINPYSIGKKPMNASVVFSGRVLFANEICKLLEDKALIIDGNIEKEMERALKWCMDSAFEMLIAMPKRERVHFFEEMKENQNAMGRIKRYLNWKQKQLFTIVGGRRLWLYKVKVVDSLKKIK